MKKIILTVVVIVVLVGAYIFYRMSSTTTPPVAPNGVMTGNPDIGNINPNTSPTGSTPPPPTTPTPKPAAGAYKDGSYTGSVADAFYGKVQVKATIKGGLITNVAFLQYPNGSGHTQEVNQYAMPLLTQEALKIQSANVDIVSGATQTSEAFQQSLGSALVQAKA